MTPTDRTVAHLRLAAEAAAAHHAAGRARREARVAQWLRRRDEYARTAAALTSHDPRRYRAVHLATRAAYRALAWEAIASGDAATARECRRSAASALRMALAIPIA